MTVKIKGICFCSTFLILSLCLGPHFVAVNNKNEIIVTDFHNHSVKVKTIILVSLSFQ